MLIPCQVSKGLRDKEVMVEITDFHGRGESMPLDRDFVVYQGNKPYLPVRVLHLHEKDQAALIALPVEADSGAHRIWVKLEGTQKTEGARMILSDRENRAAVARRVIGISNLPPVTDKRWGSHSLDLTLDAEISVWEKPDEPSGAEPPIFAPGAEGFKIDPIIHQYTKPARCDGEGYVLWPQRFVLGWTVEKIKLPYESRIGARVEGKSSLARLGLGIHVTAPTIHPGFGTKEGDPDYLGSALRLEIGNVGAYRVRLTKGMAICQILFEEVHGVPDAAYSGQFAVQGPGTAPSALPPPSPRPRKRK